MQDNYFLDKLLNDKEALLDANWDLLYDLKKRHPYSLIINQLVAKKHYLETGYLHSAHYKDTLRIQDNPGTTYANMIRWSKKSLKKRTSKLPVEEAGEIIIEEEEKKPELKFELPKTYVQKDAFEGVTNEFTLWLLKKDQRVNVDSKGMDTSGEDVIQLKEEIISESLAKIYEKQGLIGEAIEMYRKLSLKNPEKSAYFAEIIENLKKR